MYRAPQTTKLLGGTGGRGERQKERHIVLIVLRLLPMVAIILHLKSLEHKQEAILSNVDKLHFSSLIPYTILHVTTENLGRIETISPG